MPVIVSTNCTISAATVSRVRRNATADRVANHRYSSRIGTNETIRIVASGRSRKHRMTVIVTTLSTAVMRSSIAASSSSFSESTSEVSREITRPDVNRSWNAIDSAWM